jgi:hypothetical protein
MDTVRERNNQSSGIDVGVVTDHSLREHPGYTVWSGNMLVSTNGVNTHMTADLNPVRNR